MLSKKTLMYIVSIVTIVLVHVSTVLAVVDISEVPLDAQTKAAPANIMFTLDDSGSMWWEFMTVESNGLFSNNAYLYSGSFNSTERLMWKSQWFVHNKMYYDPSAIYKPWAMLSANPWQNGSLGADPDTPRSHPFVAGNNINMSSTYVQYTSVPSGVPDIVVDDGEGAPAFTVLAGDWFPSLATPEYGGDSLYSNSSPSSVRWIADIQVAGDYKCYAWWSSVTNWSRDTAAKYVVNHADGSTTYDVDQTIDFGKWVLLGTHPFNVGVSSVVLNHGNSDTSADAIKLIHVDEPPINIPIAHYYVYSITNSRPYLVIIDNGSIKYYSVTTTGTGKTESVGNLQLVANPPADVLSSRTYAEERQNFANWFSFYRRRQFTATAAVANVISQMAGVQIGISTIHNRILQPVLKIKVDGVDQTDTLLNILYTNYASSGGTPLRLGLENIGKYYDQDDGDNGGIGSCPYWADTKGGSCQQSFAILMTDGYWNGGAPSVGNADAGMGNPFEDDNSNSSNTLADVAMAYWKSDLSTTLLNQIPTSTVDSASWQHMVTYGVSFGVTGTLNPDNYDVTATPAPDIPWPNPNSNQRRIDDLYHASVNGHGTFLSASNPIELVDSLLDIMQNIKQRIGSSSSVSVNGDELYKRIDNNTYMFQSSYNTSGWLGDVKSYKVHPITGAIDLASPVWSASTVWQSLGWSTYWNTRSIATYDGDNGVVFRIGSLATAQETLLGTTPASAQLVLDYVRGDSSNEQSNSGTFRNRTTQLGDIVHSSPIYHKGILYVGANDGMMHAIRAEGSNPGTELFSYIPSQVIRNLSKLTDPTYGHNYYVDQTVTVKENVLGSGTTLLVGGLGQGGIGYYALNVSNLSTYDNSTHLWNASAINESTVASRVLWEFPHAGLSPTAAADIADIGYSFSKAITVKTNDTNHPWVVVFGNGYNSIDGQSVLFVLDPATGNVLRKFELGANIDANGDGDFDDAGDGNGLATPSVIDVDGNGTADYIYAGDLAGNMWKLDFTATNSTGWEVAFKSGSTNYPLFKAVGPTGTLQSITSKPDVMYHSEKHGYMVVFGTGKFLGTSDFLDKSVQTTYGIWDYGDDSDDSENLGSFDHSNDQLTVLSPRSTLLEQKLLLPDFVYDPDSTITGDEETVRVLTKNIINWVTELDNTASELPNPSTSTDNNAGWYFDLPKSGERIVSNMMIRDKKAIFISFTPVASPCSTGGSSIIHEIDAASGGRMNQSVFDTNNDGVVDSNDMINVTYIDDAGNSVTVSVAVSGIQRDGHLQAPAILKKPGSNEEIKYMSSTAGNIETVTESAVKTGVSSWREF